MADFSVTVFGGTSGDQHTGEIGGNKILLEFADKAYFLDFGTSFAQNGRAMLGHASKPSWGLTTRTELAHGRPGV